MSPKFVISEVYYSVCVLPKWFNENEIRAKNSFSFNFTNDIQKPFQNNSLLFSMTFQLLLLR